MFANLKLVLRSYTSLYGIFMSASLTLFCYSLKIDENRCKQNKLILFMCATGNRDYTI